MISGAIVLAAVLGHALWAPAAPESGSETQPKRAHAPFRVFVESGPSDAELVAALRLRMPERDVALAPTEALPTDPFAAVRLELADEGPSTIHVTLSDGRAYHRTIEPLDGHGVRTAAGAIANLIAAIEEQRVEPDATDVAISFADELPDPPEVDDFPDPPEDDTAGEPDPDPSEDTRPRPDSSAPTRTTEPAPAERPGWDLGLFGGGVLGLSLGPPSTSTPLFGAGGSLDVVARSPQGLLVHGAARVVSRDADVRLTRVRVAAGTGYGPRWGPVELLLHAAVFVEPLVVDQSTRHRSGQAGSPRPLLGGLVSASPGVVLSDPRARLPVRLGGLVEVSGSAEPRRSGGVVRLLTRRGDALVPTQRAGGLELTLGLTIGVWFSLPSRTSEPPAM